MTRLLISVIISCISFQSDALTLEVITDQPGQIAQVARLRKNGINVHIYDLNAGKRIEQELAQGLTGPDQHARQQLKQHIAAIGRKQFETRLQDAFRALIQSVAYQLDRYPAVVFNQGEAVVYGVTDLTTALGYYQRWKAGQ
ncbi:MAG TPA: TIGR03757 family integrating conjugative element protein [Crenotrichaceae bacterium]|nr:TIGR03757 family integrating conjugative element protein [Crenotrichaceae bacterium]